MGSFKSWDTLDWHQRTCSRFHVLSKLMKYGSMTISACEDSQPGSSLEMVKVELLTERGSLSLVWSPWRCRSS